MHEIAHALVGPGHGHDAAWRRQCLAIGARQLELKRLPSYSPQLNVIERF